jgi:hypothetical protein
MLAATATVAELLAERDDVARARAAALGAALSDVAPAAVAEAARRVASDPDARYARVFNLALQPLAAERAGGGAGGSSGADGARALVAAFEKLFAEPEGDILRVLNRVW